MEGNNESKLLEQRTEQGSRTLKRSAKVGVTLVSALAAALMGCNAPPTMTRVCVDKGDTVMAEENCKDADENYTGTAGAARPLTPHHWYYLPHANGTVYQPGTHVTGGTYVSPGHSTYVSSSGKATSAKSSSVSRGGFGHTGSHSSVHS